MNTPSSSSIKATRVRYADTQRLPGLRTWSALAALASFVQFAPAATSLEVRVLADETITRSTQPNNGSSPTWCAGAPLLVRENGRVWASIAVHDQDARPYCNTHWELWHRSADAPWVREYQGAPASEREPCPIVLVGPESLAVSIHPRILARGTHGGGELAWFCEPALAVYDPTDFDRDVRLWSPEFESNPVFSQHSYRSVGVDTSSGDMLLLVLDSKNEYRPTFRDNAGAWHPLAMPEFPIRACYPNVVLRNRAGHVLAIGDIKEPHEPWKEEKARVLKREWDYVFRRLFYTWTPDVTAGAFGQAVEIDSVEDTAGWMFNLDMVIDEEGRVHLLWVRRNIEYGFLRDRFFPGTPIVESIVHAVVEDGRIVARETLLSREIVSGETMKPPFSSGRFHQLPDGRMVAVLVAQAEPTAEAALLVQELDVRAGTVSKPVRVPLSRPPPGGMFFTNTTRGGSMPDHNLDLLGTETRKGVTVVRYIHVYIE